MAQRLSRNADGSIIDPYANSYDFTERRPDGFPLCPFCGEDELWSFDGSQEHIVGCMYCAWYPKIVMDGPTKNRLMVLLGHKTVEQMEEFSDLRKSKGALWQ